MADEADIAPFAEALHGAVVGSVGAFTEARMVAVVAAQGLASPDAGQIAQLARTATVQVDQALRALLDTDIDEQRTTPLSVLRAAVAAPTAVLDAAGARPVRPGGPERREVREDPFALAPDTLADLGDDAHQAGLAWGAAKAYIHLARRKG